MTNTKNKMLEEICTFAGECEIGSYGSYEICTGNYIDCVFYQKIIAQKIEEYDEIRRKNEK